MIEIKKNKREGTRVCVFVSRQPTAGIAALSIMSARLRTCECIVSHLSTDLLSQNSPSFSLSAHLSMGTFLANFFFCICQVTNLHRELRNRANGRSVSRGLSNFLVIFEWRSRSFDGTEMYPEHLYSLRSITGRALREWKMKTNHL